MVNIQDPLPYFLRISHLSFLNMNEAQFNIKYQKFHKINPGKINRLIRIYDESL
jgi:hypothetical protein